jgi:CelD/BcsL family acetyltransferase involved in cellulose biosynthesis
MRAYLADGLDSIGKETWNHLVSEGNTNTIFQTYQWHKAWWSAFGGDRELFIVCVSDDERIAAIAPLMVCREPDGSRVLRFIGHGRSDYLDFIHRADRTGDLDLIFAFISENRERWDSIELKYLRADSDTARKLAMLCRRHGMYAVMTDSVACPALVLGDDPDRVRNILNKKSIKRHRNYFLKKPGFKVTQLRDTSAVSAYIDRFFDQHVERWSVTYTPSLFTDPMNRVFYKGLLSEMAGNDYIVFTIVESDGSPVAFHFGFAYGNRFTWYKPSFDITLFKHWPGEVLIAELLDYATEERLEEFDFTVGDEAFKMRFANELRQNLTYKIVKTRSESCYLGALVCLRRRSRQHRILRSAVKGLAMLRNSLMPRMRQEIGEQGFLRFLWRSAKRAFEKFIFSYTSVLFFEIPASSDSIADVKPKISGVTFRALSAHEALVLDYPIFGNERSEYLPLAFERIKRGDKCFVAEHEGNAVLALWVTYLAKVNVGEVETIVDMGNEAVCLYAGTTAPDYRGNSICPWLECEIARLYHDKKKVTWCLETNIASRRLLAKVKYKLVRKYYLLKILGIKIRWSRSMDEQPAEP